MSTGERKPVVNTRIQSVIAKVYTPEFQSYIDERIEAAKPTPEERESNRKYMREYAKTPEGKKRLDKANQRYRDSDKFKVWQKWYCANKTCKQKVAAYQKSRKLSRKTAASLGISPVLFAALKVISQFETANRTQGVQDV